MKFIWMIDINFKSLAGSYNVWIGKNSYEKFAKKSIWASCVSVTSSLSYIKYCLSVSRGSRAARSTRVCEVLWSE